MDLEISLNLSRGDMSGFTSASEAAAFLPSGRLSNGMEASLEGFGSAAMLGLAGGSGSGFFWTSDFFTASSSSSSLSSGSPSLSSFLSAILI